MFLILHVISALEGTLLYLFKPQAEEIIAEEQTEFEAGRSAKRT